nr:Loki-CTERM sorting domain-containing protein [Candidatus Sigynarchaeota archaeon]
MEGDIELKKNNVAVIMTMLVAMLALFAIDGNGDPINAEKFPAGGSDPAIEGSQSGLSIVTTITIPYDIVKHVAGSGATITSIVSGATDIHSFTEPSSTQLQQISDADLMFSMGVDDLEPWLDSALTSVDFNRSNLVPLVTPAMMRADPALDGEDNPHVWMDPNNIKLMASNVTAELIEKDPGNAATYQANNATYQAQLDALLVTIVANKTLFQGVKVVTWHPAFTYLFDLLEVNQTAVIEKVEGQEPSQVYLNDVMTMAVRENVTLLVGQPQIAPEGPYQFARDAGMRIAMLTPLLFTNDQFNQPIETYIRMIEHDLWALAHPQDPPSSIPGYPLLVVIGMIGLVASLLARRHVHH